MFWFFFFASPFMRTALIYIPWDLIFFPSLSYLLVSFYSHVTLIICIETNKAHSPLKKKKGGSWNLCRTVRIISNRPVVRRRFFLFFFKQRYLIAMKVSSAAAAAPFFLSTGTLDFFF